MLLHCLEQCVPVVFLYPGGQISFIAIVFDDVEPQLRNRSVDGEVMIDPVAFIDLRLSPPEQLEQIFWVIAAVLYPSSTKDLSPVEVTTSDTRALRPTDP